MSDLESLKTELMSSSVAHFMETSKVKSNGIREVPKAAYFQDLAKHDVSEEDVRRVQKAVDHANEAAARVALADMEEKIAGASKEDLANEEFRKGLSSTVRLPTFGGATEVSVQAEVFNNIPFRGDADGNGEAPARKATYGRLRTTINTKGRISKDFGAEADSRMRKALGIAPAVVD